jgi:hypothetical protein
MKASGGVEGGRDGGDGAALVQDGSCRDGDVGGVKERGQEE